MFVLLAATIFLSTTIVLLIFIYKRIDHYNFCRNLDGPYSLPYFGNLRLMLSLKNDVLKAFREYLRIYPDMIAFWFFGDMSVITDDPQYIKKILSKSGISKPPRLSKLWEAATGSGILTMTTDNDIEYARWKIRHKIMSGSLKTNKIRSYADIMYRNNSILVDNIKNMINLRKPFDLESYVLRGHAITTLEALFRVKLDFFSDKLDDPLEALYKIDYFVMEKSKNFWFDLIKPLYKHSQLYKLERFCFDSIHRLASYVWEEMKSDLEKTNSDHLDETVMIDALLKAVRDGAITENEAIHEIMNIWPAGIGTVVATTFHLLCCLAMHPECQKRLFEELHDFYQTTTTVYPQEEHLTDDAHFPYLSSCYKETLRLFPTGAILPRRSVEEIYCEKKKVNTPRGVNFLISMYWIYRDPKYWRDPERFEPARWLDPLQMQMVPQNAFFPFGSGPRQCPGAHLAKVELKRTIINLVLNFEFRSDLKFAETPIQAAITTRFAQKIHLQTLNRASNKN